MKSFRSSVRPPVAVLYDVDPGWPEPDRAESLRQARLLCDGIAAAGHEVREIRMEDDRIEQALEPFDPTRWIVFNWCESLPGVYRGDILAARVLEDKGYVFTGAAASIIESSWDKRWVRRRLAEAGVPMPVGRFADTPDVPGWDRFPAIVKPAGEHCSVGVGPESVVYDERSLRERVAWVIEHHGPRALVEEFIDGPEYHVALLGNDPPRVLPPAEMDFSAYGDPRDRLCSWDSKFTPGSDAYERIAIRVPAPLDEDARKRLDAVCQAAYRAVECRDWARMDVRLRDGTFHVLDANPNADPGPDTSMAMAAAHVGLDYGGLIARIVAHAAVRLRETPDRFDGAA